MRKLSDVIIIGGGVLGCAIAYYLAGLNRGHVLLLERRTVAGANSPLAAGLLSRSRPTAALIPLVAETYAAIANLEDELSQSLGLQQVGSLHVAASPAARAGLADLVKTANDAGVAAERITPADAMRMVPWLALNGDEAAACFPTDAFVDPYLLTQAYAYCARGRGVTIREGVAVTGVRSQGQRVVGVETSEGFVAGQVAIDAAGAWAGILAWQLGIGLPMAPVRSQYWITAPHRLFAGRQPIVLLPDARAYTRPECGSLLFGIREAQSMHVDPFRLPEDISGLGLSNDSEGWDSLMEGIPGLARFSPAIEGIGIAHHIAGLSTYTPDGNFVLGEVPGLEGFLVATGCSGAGIAASGGIGLALAQLATGHTPSFDLTPHRVDRFGPVDPTTPVFRQRCADARSMKGWG
jgi:4-methylaminobutanoate oxidase (formaldehyde-forming)